MYNITVFITRIVWAIYVELYNCEELVESISGREGRSWTKDTFLAKWQIKCIFIIGASIWFCWLPKPDSNQRHTDFQSA